MTGTRMETDSLVENIDPFQGQGGDISTLDRRNTELKGRFEDLKVWKKGIAGIKIWLLLGIHLNVQGTILLLLVSGVKMTISADSPGVRQSN